VGVATNGLLLTEELARELHDSGVGYFEVSLPSPDEETFELLCRSDSSASARRAIVNAVSTGASVTVSSLLAGVGIEFIGDVVSIAFALGAEAVVLNRFAPGVVTSPNVARALTPSHGELMSALSAAGKKGRELGLPVYTGLPLEGCLFDLSTIEGVSRGACVCGRGKWVIDPAGNLRVCEQSPIRIGSLLDTRFEELREATAVKAFLANTRRDHCASCDSFAVCGGGCRFTN
jgi:radical SAM protein with 4Fe4S-binding SPASM domain